MEEERKRVIAIVAGIIIAAVLCIPTDSLLAKPNESNAKKETKATDHTPNSVISTNREETKPDEHKTQARLPKWYASSEWWLVIVAALTAVFIAWQAKETANATKAMRDGMPLQKLSADAALLNAQAVINAERPWIFIEESESAKAADHRQAYVRIMGRNKGRTPAEITVVSCVFGWIPYDHEYPDEPEYPLLNSNIRSMFRLMNHLRFTISIVQHLFWMECGQSLVPAENG